MGVDGAPILPILAFDDFQHNRRLRVLFERVKEIVQAAKKAKASWVAPAAEATAKHVPPAKQVGVLARIWQRLFGDKDNAQFTSVHVAVGGTGLG